MAGYTCPFSRCRLPIATNEDLVAHVDATTKDPADHNHYISGMTPEGLAAEVRHMLAANLRLEQSCGHYKAVADSWHEAYALGQLRAR